ncbi:hydroxymethylbilane synthase [Swaminathania salitolerans]|uniref:Porphobilinogen deaminase n=1 Tax=Swaminathania salitolerans TaxID=182838 RepID=A0A511BSU5_9PROT|nr:hydroxymethylbilane synthase [Swaminathania salitolerans]GEL02674.1 porphobilinogen deaminase [Swaminathania salitolerans]
MTISPARSPIHDLHGATTLSPDVLGHPLFGQTLRIGTRASPLALVQTRSFMAQLGERFPFLELFGGLREQRISTKGDRDQIRRLAEIGGKGLFSKEIHQALRAGEIDFAVHSLKDLETFLPNDLVLGCVLRREDPRDALVLRDRASLRPGGDPLDALPAGAVIGCASIRRQAQLLARRPDLRFCLIRGNVQTRLAKLEAGACDATFLALAGLNRLGLGARADVIFEPEDMLPACGQGMIGITLRRSDAGLLSLMPAIEDRESRLAARAERALLEGLDGSCRTPVGGFARIVKGELVLHGLIAAEDGSFVLRRSLSGAPEEGAGLGAELAAILRRDTPPDLFARLIGQPGW